MIQYYTITLSAADISRLAILIGNVSKIVKDTDSRVTPYQSFCFRVLEAISKTEKVQDEKTI